MALILGSILQLALLGGLFQVSFWLTISDRTIGKLSPYECGLEPIGDARMKFEIVYYLIGILYLVFDLEIIFLFPLATIQYSLVSVFAFGIAIIFLIILTIGFLYEWFNGALEIATPLPLYLYHYHSIYPVTPVPAPPCNPGTPEPLLLNRVFMV